jgi:hypothetical protein
MTIYIKRSKKILNNENIQKLFLQGKSLGFCGSKNIFFKPLVQNCGGEEKVNLGIFPLFCAKNAQSGRG